MYRYRPENTDIQSQDERDLRPDLVRACLSQSWIEQAPVALVITAVYSRSTEKYGERGVRYAHIEAGCAAQNVFLMAVSMDLAAGIVGAFDDEKVGELCGGKGASPLLVMPVGYSA